MTQTRTIQPIYATAVAKGKAARKSKGPITIYCPADKSLTHRAFIFAGLAFGESRIENPLLGADCLSTMKALEAIGVEITTEKTNDKRTVPVAKVRSPGWEKLHSPKAEIDFGNSGTTARLMMGVFAATPGLTANCTGDESLRARPMARVVNPLLAMGAQITSPDGNLDRLPLSVTGGKLKAMDHVVDKASAQIKSALLLAGLNGQGLTSVTLPFGSRNHTEIILKRLGAEVRMNTLTSAKTGTETITVRGPFRPQALDVKIPVDPSSAAFFAVAAAIAPVGFSEVVLPHVVFNATRLGFVHVMRRMGCQITMQPLDVHDEFVEPVVNLNILPSPVLVATEVGASELPTLIDEIPILAVLASFAKGMTRFVGLGELRVKESDRIATTAELLDAAGVSVQIVGDDLIVHGGHSEIEEFTFDCKGDHRLAMAAAVLALRAEGPCTIEQASCVNVSFPGFFERLDDLK